MPKPKFKTKEEALKNKPERMPVLEENIPEELKKYNQWVVWKYKVRKDNQDDYVWAKPLYSVKTGQQASSTNPETWSTFEDAINICNKYSGIGFVFTEEDPFCGIDLDDCLKDGNLEDWAAKYVNLLNSYTEISPSGTGVKILVDAELPHPTGKKKGNIETYTNKRYFTITGNIFNGLPSSINKRQNQYNKFCAEVFPEKPKKETSKTKNKIYHSDDILINIARYAENGDKFRLLWEGRWEEDKNTYPTHSEADMALCNMLAFWTANDFNRIDRLFRQSGLYREKWEREDYRERVINKAIESIGDEVYKPGKETQAQKLQQIGMMQYLFHDQSNRAYILIKDEAFGRRIYPIKSQNIIRYLGKCFYQQKGNVVSPEAIRSVLNTLEGIAVFDSSKHTLHKRIAWHEGAIYYYLADEKSCMVKITSKGWEIVGDDIEEDLPILFKHTESHSEQCRPVKEIDGNVFLLKDFITNISSEDDEMLFIITIIAGLVPDCPHPIFHFIGSEDSGKSSLLIIVRESLDPSPKKIASLPKQDKTMSIQLEKNYVCCWDNITKLDDIKIDKICMACTGGVDADRKYYTDDEEITYDLKSIVGISSIPDIFYRADAIRRAFMFRCESISEDERIDEIEYVEMLHQQMPEIFTGMINTLVKAIEIKERREAEGTVPRNLPSLAAFGKWMIYIGEALGLDEDEVRRIYGKNIEEQRLALAEGDILSKVILNFMQERKKWSGKMSELHPQLETYAENRMGLENLHWDKSWPRTDSWLGRRLKQAKGNLEKLGLIINESRPEQGKIERRYEIINTNFKGVEKEPSTTTMEEEDCFGKYFGKYSDCPNCAYGRACWQECREDKEKKLPTVVPVGVADPSGCTNLVAIATGNGVSIAFSGTSPTANTANTAKPLSPRSKGRR